MALMLWLDGMMMMMMTTVVLWRNAHVYSSVARAQLAS
jgi:hypothetical protein